LAADDQRSRWEGTVTITVDATLGTSRPGACEYTATYRLDARLLEGDSEPAFGRSGERIGTMTELEDGGTRFTVTLNGTCTNPDPDPCDCPEDRPDACETILVSSEWTGNASGEHALEGKRFAADDPEHHRSWYAFGAPMSHTTITSGGVHSEDQRCYDTVSRELPMFPVPYIAVGAPPDARMLPPANDTEVRSVDAGVMHGSYSYRQAVAPPTAYDVRVRWSLSKRSNVVCRLEDLDADWRPRHIVLDEAATPAEVTARLRHPEGATGRFRFTLSNVSREIGWALNRGSSHEPDLSFYLDVGHSQQPGFEPVEDSDDGPTITTAEPAGEATVRVGAWDWGAWGEVGAEVQLDGIWYRCLSASQHETVPVPRDDDGDHIADGWEAQHGVEAVPADTDGDTAPPGREVGDGLSVYEEYRGLFTARSPEATGWASSQGEWTDTDPLTKDLFIRDTVGLGAGPFGTLGLAVHFLDDDHWSGTEHRIVNFNLGYAAARPLDGQKGLLLAARELPAGTSGMAWPCVGSPHAVEEVRVDPSQVVDPAELLAIIAHELGHGVGLHHPGPPWITRECNGQPSTAVATSGGVCSGPVENLMRYSNAAYYEGPDGSCHPYPERDSWGSTFVSDLTGTGFNAGPERTEGGHPLPVAGDATWIETLRTQLTLTADGCIDPTPVEAP
jgi:hypothetical protein